MQQIKIKSFKHYLAKFKIARLRTNAEATLTIPEVIPKMKYSARWYWAAKVNLIKLQVTTADII